MQQLIAAELLAATSHEGFSLDELVLRLRECMTEEGLPAILRLILELVDESLALAHVTGRAQPRQPCSCGHDRYELKDRQDRRLRTSVGTVVLRLRRLCCRACRKVFVPLRAFLGLDRWQSKTGELERIVVEVMSEQSYRRGSAHLDTIGEIPVPKSTAHRWVAQTPASHWDFPDPDPQALLADGTGFKRRPDPAAGLTNRGEVRGVVGLTKAGRWVGYGVWSQEKWEQIGQTLHGPGATPAVQSPMLVTDGEPGLAEALAGVANRAQRCRWHLVDQLKYSLYQDGVKAPGQREPTQALAGLLAIDVPAGEFEQVKPEEKAVLAEQIQQARRQVDDLIGRLRQKQYEKAAGYLEAARERMFRWLEFWLETGLVTPATTGYLERLMRELGRRLKKLGFGWTDAGAAQMARILLRRITDPEEWADYWKKRLRLDGKVQIHFRAVKAIPA
jgi:hypothetical protein